MRNLLLLFFSCFAFPWNSYSQTTDNLHAVNSTSKPKMQIVFTLDATGSMGGLISAAKDKIWSIVNSLTQTQTATAIEVGMLFYRDRGDVFITKKVQLTDSMDFVYGELMKVQAQGGGDGPESVNQGLNEAVELFNWSKDTSTYKAIFLIGDFEPHMDYKDDIPYHITCKIARSRDIVINTILMGNNKVAERIWKEIAECDQGMYVNLNMNVNDIAMATPYDSTIALLSNRLDGLKYYYGSTSIKIRGISSKMKAAEVSKNAKANVMAQRAEYNTNVFFAKTSGTKQNELLSDISSGSVQLDSLQKEELPDEFKNMSKDSIQLVAKEKIALRDSLQKELQMETAKRNSYIEAELNKMDKIKVENSFNNTIYKNIQKQTLKKKIILKGKVKY